VVGGFDEGLETVIASEATQSMPRHEERMDCFVASAPRNDGRHIFAFSRRDCTRVRRVAVRVIVALSQ
jgi:hypothetical protein